MNGKYDFKILRDQLESPNPDGFKSFRELKARADRAISYSILGKRGPWERKLAKRMRRRRDREVYVYDGRVKQRIYL